MSNFFRRVGAHIFYPITSRLAPTLFTAARNSWNRDQRRRNYFINAGLLVCARIASPIDHFDSLWASKAATYYVLNVLLQSRAQERTYEHLKAYVESGMPHPLGVDYGENYAIETAEHIKLCTKSPDLRHKTTELKAGLKRRHITPQLPGW